jgi:hypothetical protein
MFEYNVQITEGHANNFLWEGRALGQDHAETLARDAFERKHRRRPDHEIVTSEARAIPERRLVQQIAQMPR